MLELGLIRRQSITDNAVTYVLIRCFWVLNANIKIGWGYACNKLCCKISISPTKSKLAILLGTINLRVHKSAEKQACWQPQNAALSSVYDVIQFLLSLPVLNERL